MARILLRPFLWETAPLRRGWSSFFLCLANVLSHHICSSWHKHTSTNHTVASVYSCLLSCKVQRPLWYVGDAWFDSLKRLSFSQRENISLSYRTRTIPDLFDITFHAVQSAHHIHPHHESFTMMHNHRHGIQDVLIRVYQQHQDERLSRILCCSYNNK